VIVRDLRHVRAENVEAELQKVLQSIEALFEGPWKRCPDCDGLDGCRHCKTCRGEAYVRLSN